MIGEPVLIVDATAYGAARWAQRAGIDQFIPITNIGDLAGHRGRRLIVLPDYVRIPQSYELIVRARQFGLRVEHRNYDEGAS